MSRAECSAVTIVLAAMIAGCAGKEATLTMAKVKRENGKVQIQDVPVMSWARDCSFAGAVEAATAASDTRARTERSVVSRRSLSLKPGARGVIMHASSRGDDA